ncbi:MAG: hypothetical protein AB7O98_19065 [Hyphomonadaceae bacterium]
MRAAPAEHHVDAAGVLMRGLVAALFVLLLAQAPAGAQDLMTPSEFRDAAIALIRAEVPEAQIEIRDELGITVRRPENQEMTEFSINFDNGYAEYQRNPDAVTDILDRWVSFAILPPEESQMAERVVAVLRTRDTLTSYAAALAQGETPATLVWRPFAGDLVEIIVFDGAETIQYASEQSLSDIGLTPDMAWAMAPGNLPARLGELEVGGVDGADRLVYVTGGNGLAPSSLTDAQTCSGDRATWGYLIVERNGFIATDLSDAVARVQFRDLFEDLLRQQASLSITPLACRDGRLAAVTLTD